MARGGDGLMINTNCWRQPVPVSVFELPLVARLIYQELLLNAARNDNGGFLTTSNKHHYKLERGQCFFSDLTLAKILNRDRKTIERWRKYLEKRGNSMGNSMGNEVAPLIRSRPTRDGRIYTLLDYDKVIGMGNSNTSSVGNTLGNSMGTDIRLQNTYTLTYEEKRDSEKVIETKNLITQENGEKKIQPIVLAQEPFLPKVPEKGITAAVRSDALVALVQISKEFGLMIRWEGNEDEIKEAVDLLGLEQVLQAMRDYCEYCSKQGFTQVLWNKFKANRLSQSSPKEQIERVKKAPEYQQDRAKQLEKRATVSYTSMPNMQKINPVYLEAINAPKKETPTIVRMRTINDRFQKIGKQRGVTIEFNVPSLKLSEINSSDEDIINAGLRLLDAEVRRNNDAPIAERRVIKEFKIKTLALSRELEAIQRLSKGEVVSDFIPF